jgi:hypothetical protein
MNKHIFREKSTFRVLLLSLAVYSFFTVFFFHYERLTGDATLYVSIAEKYIRGDFGDAVNGYWGPLLAWLLIPFLALGATDVFAINALNLIFGLLTITGVFLLSVRFEMDEKIRRVMLVPLAPILIFISLVQPMDFLLLCVLVFYLNIVFRKDYPVKVSNAVLAGLLGAFAYFSKPYGFPFFISHFLLMHLCHYFSGSSARRNVLRNAIAGFLVFSLLSGSWIALISNKYGYLTFSNMGRGVFAALGPESEHDTLEKGDPIFFEGFFEPPNDTAYVIYEDPSTARETTWSPLESEALLKHFISNFLKNIREILRVYESYSGLSIAILIVYVLFLFATPFKALFTRGEILYPFLTVTLYTAGYAPFHIEARYLWIINILLFLMGGKVLTELFRHDFFRRRILKQVMLTLFIISFVITPIKSVLQSWRGNINRQMHMLGMELGDRYHVSGNIASNRKRVEIATHDSWHQTFRLAYWLKSRYFGQARENISDEALEKELKELAIDYYFFWGEADDAPKFLSRYRELTGGEIPDLRIYSLKEKKIIN